MLDSSLMTDFGKIVTATAISVLVHVTLFTVLALMPEAAPVQAASSPDDPPLEVTIHSAEALTPVPLNPVLPDPAEPRGIATQIDPENLKKTDKPPEHATAIAAHDSQATFAKSSPAAPVATPGPQEPGLAVQPVAPPSDDNDAPGIDALGNYSKAVGNAIGVRAKFYSETQKQLAVGEVRLKFSIDARGQVSDLRILSNSAQPANAVYALRAVKEAKIPPIPPERLAQVSGGRIEIVYTFTIYPTP
jgi:TonB family protein